MHKFANGIVGVAQSEHVQAKAKENVYISFSCTCVQSKDSFMRDLSSNRPLSSNDVDKAIVETREKVNGSCLIVFVCSIIVISFALFLCI